MNARNPETASYVLDIYGIADFLDEKEARDLVRRLRARDLVLDIYKPRATDQCIRAIIEGENHEEHDGDA